MPAETLNCPMCGASVSSDSTACEHCGARLATVACPSCFGMIFLGSKFCSHCGAKVERAEVSAEQAELCPRCKTDLTAVTLGRTTVRECPKCEGLWVDTDSLNQICADREQQSLILGTAVNLPTDPSGDLEVVRYLPCPVCQELMQRVNFAHCSHVIVDVCKPHGTWFDKDELRRIVEFIRAGGMEKARQMEIEELESQRRALDSARAASQSSVGSSGWENTSAWPSPRYSGFETGISAVAAMLRGFLR